MHALSFNLLFSERETELRAAELSSRRLSYERRRRRPIEFCCFSQNSTFEKKIIFLPFCFIRVCCQVIPTRTEVSFRCFILIRRRDFRCHILNEFVYRLIFVVHLTLTAHSVGSE
jgi:hypothetical protein